MDLKRTKLIIWDLDDTIWKGTISEGEVEIKSAVVDFINDTLDMGIVHSICSKNDYQQAKEKLETFGIWNLFVFPSIDWTPKGARIRSIIEEMNLRAENVLFVDDNAQNLEEAKFFCDSIMTEAPEAINSLNLRSGGGTMKRQIRSEKDWHSIRFCNRKQMRGILMTATLNS